MEGCGGGRCVLVSVCCPLTLGVTSPGLEPEGTGLYLASAACSVASALVSFAQEV